jgi:mRNA-degrading endonuclease YafQ of YafQ-DinJ toxin-antitoxin module
MVKIDKIYYAPKFERRFKRLPAEIQLKALEIEIIFRNNCFDAKLKTHKLAGGYKNHWSFSISYSYRIIFKFLDNQKVLFIDVGSHSIYQ